MYRKKGSCVSLSRNIDIFTSVVCTPSKISITRNSIFRAIFVRKICAIKFDLYYYFYGHELRLYLTSFTLKIQSTTNIKPFQKYTCYKTIPYYFDFQFQWDNGGSFQCNIVSRTSFVFPRTIIIFSAILAFLMHQGVQEKKIYILKRLSRSINFPNAFKAHYNFLS